MGTISYPDFPRQVKIEPVYGCDRKCAFCSLSNEDAEPIYMSEETFTRVLNEVTPERVKQIGVSIHGEPTMHPQYLDMIARIRDKLPTARILTFTNGYRFKRDLTFLGAMLDAGASHIHVDLYDKATEKVFYEGIEAYAGRAHIANGYIENVWTSSHKTLISYLPIKQALFEDTQVQREFNTQGGATKFSNWKKFGKDTSVFPVLKTCKELNKYLTITAEGYGKICCADGSRSLYLGNVKDMSMAEMWTSEKADMIRYALHRGRRDLIPACYACDRPSFRDALWPHWGKAYALEEIRAMVIKNFRCPKDFMRNIQDLDEEAPITREPLAGLLAQHLAGLGVTRNYPL